MENGKLKPTCKVDQPAFITFCKNVWTLPTEFDDCLTYAEQMQFIMRFLRDQIIPCVNGNGEAVKELQNKFIELAQQTHAEIKSFEDFVNAYFNNLDVQAEINNKLDQMVADGTLENILGEYINLIRIFNTVDEMKADQKLKNGQFVKCYGYKSKYDGRGGNFIISNSKDTSYGYTLNNGLIANLLDDEIVSNLVYKPEAKDIKLKKGQTLNGSISTSVKVEATKSAVNVNGQDVTIKDISITNPDNLNEKTAVDCTGEPNSAGLSMDNVKIGNNFDKGLNLNEAYFSSFTNVRVGKTKKEGVNIGGVTNNWTGVQNFVNCQFDSGKPTILIDKEDTNTISFDNCCFENITNNVIENKGKAYFNRCYYGDMVKNKLETHILNAHGKSQTHFNDCTMVINSDLNSDGSMNTYFDLHDGATCYVNGGKIWAGNRFHASAIYSSNSEKDTIYIDNLRNWEAVNWTPYYLYPYSPLRSINPMKSYVINGCLTDNLQNELGKEPDGRQISKWNKNTSYVNPFGGIVVEVNQNNDGWKPYTFYYEIPENYVGKEMKLQVYGFGQIVTGISCILSSNDLSRNPNLEGNANFEVFDQYQTNKEFNNRNVFANEFTVYPKTRTGKFIIRYQDNGVGYLSLSGVAMLDKCHSLQMGTFETEQKRVCDHKPQYTAGAKKGDIVYNFAKEPTCVGWLYNGTQWNELNTIS